MTFSTTSCSQVKDIFDACAKDDESRIKAQLKEGGAMSGEPVANLDNFHDNTNDEHFGNVVQKAGSGKSNNVVHQNIIKRYYIDSTNFSSNISAFFISCFLGSTVTQ